jgi:hypothetical protein
MLADLRKGVDPAAVAVKYRISLKHVRRKILEWRESGEIDPVLSVTRCMPEALVENVTPVTPVTPAAPASVVPKHVAEFVHKICRPHDVARNMRIMELSHGDKALSAGQVARMLAGEYPDITRNVVISLRGRILGKDSGKQFREPKQVSDQRRRIAAKRRAARGRVAAERREQHAPACVDAPERQGSRKGGFVFRKNPDPTPYKPEPDRRSPEQIGEDTLRIRDALMTRTGCAWPDGDVRDGTLTYCDADRAERVSRDRLTGQRITVTLPYCARHAARLTTARIR